MSASSPPPSSTATPAVACYRHPKVPAPVSCTRCERPICSDCMISAPVGWQCRNCTKGAPPVRTMRDLQSGFALSLTRPYVTYALIAICVCVYAAQETTDITERGTVRADAVADGEIWRVFTSGFMHGGPIHLLFNMLILFQLGTALEGRLGRGRYLGLYAASMAGGSIGAMLLQKPNVGALGASGAVFGLMGAVVVLSKRGRSPIESGVGGLLAINLVLSFVLPGISIGGHLGGLVAGAIGGLVIRGLGEKVGMRLVVLTTALLVTTTLGLVAAAGPVAAWRCDSETTGSALSPAARAEYARIQDQYGLTGALPRERC